MKPVFATVTCSSHYTLATGLYEESHGLIGNRFYDPVTNTSFKATSHDRHFFLGEPIWVTAKRQGKKTAVINWIGGEVDWGSESPDVVPKFSNEVPLRDRLDHVIKLLSEDDMDLVMLYFNQPDRAGHTYGALSNEVLEELEVIDREFDRLFRIMQGKDLLDKTNIIILSDHGMTNLTADPFIVINLDADVLEENTIKIMISDTIAHFFVKQEGRRRGTSSDVPDREMIIMNHLRNLKESRGHFQVFLKKDIPERWHYRDSPRIGDIILVADPGYYLVPHKVRHYKKKTWS
jgi:ectonucleotide pyrophosphatase/phosphodiesterase family protein 5